jgi:hypothetical protein
MYVKPEGHLSPFCEAWLPKELLLRLEDWCEPAREELRLPDALLPSEAPLPSALLPLDILACKCSRTMPQEAHALTGQRCCRGGEHLSRNCCAKTDRGHLSHKPYMHRKEPLRSR